MRIRKDLLEPSNDEHNVNIPSLSHSRKIAIKSIKEKIDDQAKVIEDEETQLKEKCDYYRRKEEKLRIMKQKIDIIEGKDRFEEDIEEDRRDGLIRDLQIDYDKYLKLYQKEEING